MVFGCGFSVLVKGFGSFGYRFGVSAERFGVLAYGFGEVVYRFGGVGKGFFSFDYWFDRLVDKLKSGALTTDAMANYDQVPPIFWDDPLLFYDSTTVPITKRKKRMSIIKSDLSGFTLPELIAELQKVVGLMTGNATFSTIAAKTTALGTGTTALVSASGTYDSAIQTADQKMTLRDTARDAAEGLYQALGTAAEAVTQDPAQLQSGGWTLRSDTSAPVGMLAAPSNPSVSCGDMAGSVDFHWDSMKRGVQTFLGEYSTSPDGPWTQFYAGKKSSTTASGLVSGTMYWFRVRAVGAAGPGPYSSAISHRAE